MSSTPAPEADRPRDRTDRLVVRWRSPGRSAERIVFEPRVDGWYKREEIWDGRRWRTRGTEVVDEVAVEGVGEAKV